MIDLGTLPGGTERTCWAGRGTPDAGTFAPNRIGISGREVPVYQREGSRSRS